MNENYFIKISGKANVPEKIEIGHNYHLEIDASVTSESKIDNENGEFDIISKVEPITITIQKDNGPVSKAKDTRKNSVKFRNYLYKLWSEDGCIYPFDEVYEMVVLEAMSVTPSFLRSVIKRLDEK
jgi:hypothetical protein